MSCRVVVTGYGVLNAMGLNKDEVYENLFSGRTGIEKSSFTYVGKEVFGSVGNIKCDLVNSFFEEHKLYYDRCSQLAIMAAQECMEHSGILNEEISDYRKGVVVGTSLGGMLSGDKFHSQWLCEGLEKADKELLRQYPLHAIADILALKFGLKGVKAVISTACAAGSNALGYGFDMIRSGKYDMILAGGVDPLSRFSFAGFTSLKALDEEACKPYSKSEGINLGEGASFVVLEDYERAVARNASIIAEISGYGLSADAYHQTAPDLGGRGAVKAMMSSINQSGISIKDISYVNGHGTGTTSNDVAESRAFKTVFKEHINEVPLSSIKGSVGHCLGAAGAVEAAAAIMCLEHDKVPPTVNFYCDVKNDINYVPDQAQDKICNAVLSNSFAFGGNNCSVLLNKLTLKHETRPVTDDKIVITGIGCMGVGGTNIQELWETFDKAVSCIGEITNYSTDKYMCKWSGIMPEVEWKKYIPSKFLRRIDEVTKMAMCSGKQALLDSGIKITSRNMDSVGTVYATGTGPLETIEGINRAIIEEGITAVNPFNFPNSVINASVGNFCIANMLKGPTSTLSVGGVSVIVAFTYAMELLKSGQAEAIVVLSSDECNEPMVAGNDKMGLLSRKCTVPFCKDSDGMILSAGSTAFVLETKEHAKNRGAKIYATVKGYSIASDNVPLCTVNPDGTALEKCVLQALEESGIEKLDYYASSANGVPEIDHAEAEVISKLFDKDTYVSSIQALLGSATGTAGGYGLLSALYSFEKNTIVPMPEGNYDLLDKVSNRLCKKGNNSAQIKTACISASSFGGACASLVIEND